MQALFDQLDWLLPLCLLCLGLVVGSFLNVVIYRLPLMMETAGGVTAASCWKLPQEKEAHG